MSDHTSAAERQEAREEVLWHLAVDLANAAEAIDRLGLYTATVHIGGRSFGLGHALCDLNLSVNRILDPEEE